LAPIHSARSFTGLSFGFGPATDKKVGNRRDPLGALPAGESIGTAQADDFHDSYRHRRVSGWQGRGMDE
jgi:hypothetical protein